MRTQPTTVERPPKRPQRPLPAAAAADTATRPGQRPPQSVAKHTHRPILPLAVSVFIMHGATDVRLCAAYRRVLPPSPLIARSITGQNARARMRPVPDDDRCSRSSSPSPSQRRLHHADGSILSTNFATPPLRERRCIWSIEPQNWSQQKVSAIHRFAEWWRWSRGKQGTTRTYSLYLLLVCSV